MCIRDSPLSELYGNAAATDTEMSAAMSAVSLEMQRSVNVQQTSFRGRGGAFKRGRSFYGYQGGQFQGFGNGGQYSNSYHGRYNQNQSSSSSERKTRPDEKKVEGHGKQD